MTTLHKISAGFIRDGVNSLNLDHVLVPIYTSDIDQKRDFDILHSTDLIGTPKVAITSDDCYTNGDCDSNGIGSNEVIYECYTNGDCDIHRSKRNYKPPVV